MTAARKRYFLKQDKICHFHELRIKSTDQLISRKPIKSRIKHSRRSSCSMTFAREQIAPPLSSGDPSWPDTLANACTLPWETRMAVCDPYGRRTSRRDRTYVGPAAVTALDGVIDYQYILVLAYQNILSLKRE